MASRLSSKLTPSLALTAPSCFITVKRCSCHGNGRYLPVLRNSISSFFCTDLSSRKKSFFQQGSSKLLAIRSHSDNSSVNHKRNTDSHSRGKHTVCMATKTDGSSSNTLKKVLVPIGTGTEEMEAVIVIDVLRRAGADVTVASVEPSGIQIVASRKVKLIADTTISECVSQHWDLVVLPGGMPGAERLRDSKELKEITARQAAKELPYAAICAAPAVALDAWGLLKGRQATAHPAFTGQLSDPSAAEKRVISDGPVTTSRGPGTAFEFALELVERLYGKEKRETVAGPMVMLKGDGMDVMKLEYGAQWPIEGAHSGSSAPSLIQALVPIADGAEEMEAVILIDVLRRAGVQVTVASVHDRLEVVASRKVKLVADVPITECTNTNYDLVVLPGGLLGAENFRDSAVLTEILKKQAQSKRMYGAICASPAIVLAAHGLLQGKKATCHPSLRDKLPSQEPHVLEARVVSDGLVMTSCGPGTSFEFALALVERLCGSAKVAEVAKPMVLDKSLMPASF